MNRTGSASDPSEQTASRVLRTVLGLSPANADEQIELFRRDRPGLSGRAQHRRQGRRQSDRRHPEDAFPHEVRNKDVMKTRRADRAGQGAGTGPESELTPSPYSEISNNDVCQPGPDRPAC